MKKLRISIDDLAVESFNTSAPGDNTSGTVHAHLATDPGCAISVGTCFQSCARTNGYGYCILPYC